MASKRAAVPAKHLFNGFRGYEQPPRHFQQCLTRSMATEAPLPNITLSKAYDEANLESTETQPLLEDKVEITPSTPISRATQVQQPYQPPPNPFMQTASCTLYSFPKFEPTGFTYYPQTHLLLPLRKDILHQAVIFEGDAKRSGTASTKWRSEVHGSGRKIRPQKGSGKARLGDKKSPMLKGGGIAFGPKPRDFSSLLNEKVYDRAWRTALSYRYRMGELIVIDAELDIMDVHEHSMERYVKNVLGWNRLTEGGRPLFVSMERREGLFTAFEEKGMGRFGRALEIDDVDIKDLLEGSRVVVEAQALNYMFEQHESDLAPRERLSGWEKLLRSAAPSQEAVEV